MNTGENLALITFSARAQAFSTGPPMLNISL
jgi:hypothetical protein